jgi:hypothetical protein
MTNPLDALADRFHIASVALKLLKSLIERSTPGRSGLG